MTGSLAQQNICTILPGKPREVMWMDEEVVLLEEQLATAHADIERLQTQIADARSQGLAARHGAAGAADAATNQPRRREAAQSQLAAQADETRSACVRRFREAESQSREALQRYREAALAARTAPARRPRDRRDGLGARRGDRRGRGRRWRRCASTWSSRPRRCACPPARRPAAARIRPTSQPAEKIRLGLQQT